MFAALRRVLARPEFAVSAILFAGKTLFGICWLPVGTFADEIGLAAIRLGFGFVRQKHGLRRDAADGHAFEIRDDFLGDVRGQPDN